MKGIYDEKHASRFIKGITRLTGISESKLTKYASENNLFNVLEHPRTINPNNQQLEKIYILNEFVSMYGLLKLQENESRLSFSSSKIAGEYFTALLGGIKDREKFMAAFLDTGNNIIELKTFSEGSISEAVVYPREILQAALNCDCKAIILAHNHPGGSLNPSIQDRDLTQKLISIFTPLQISVLDHIIVAGTNYHSMMEKGTMPQPTSDICYNAVSLNDRKAAEEERADYQLNASTHRESELDNSYWSELNGQEDEDEWEI
ncbi:JAB domain-containing protein [Dehalobacterium formicoaceticum]|uniref:JAB domain-containing protein n=1 Tax=Dehalobacterium formicoaceticum TaxID=51515 RepID=UPI0031F65772